MGWQVSAKQCRNCLFGPSPLVSRERRAEILDECQKEGRPFECHLASIRDLHVTCRAFYDQPDRLLPDLAQIAKRLHEGGIMEKAVEFVDLPELHEEEVHGTA